MSRVDGSAYLIKNVAYNANECIEFLGEALSGTDDNVAKWRIKKLTYDVNNNIETVKWANGEHTQFTVIWNARGSLNYK